MRDFHEGLDEHMSNSPNSSRVQPYHNPGALTPLSLNCRPLQRRSARREGNKRLPLQNWIRLTRQLPVLFLLLPHGKDGGRLRSLSPTMSSKAFLLPPLPLRASQPKATIGLLELLAVALARPQLPHLPPLTCLLSLGRSFFEFCDPRTHSINFSDGCRNPCHLLSSLSTTN